MESNKIFDDMESVFETTFENWEILEDCTIVSKNCRYTIEGDRLLEQNWLNHILNKVEGLEPIRDKVEELENRILYILRL